MSKKIVLIIILMSLLAGSFVVYKYFKIPAIQTLSDNQQPVFEVQSVNKTASETQTTDWKTYSNEKYGFSIKYPESLTYYEFSDGSTMAFISTNQPEEQSTQSVHIEYIDRSSLESEKCISLREYAENYLDSYKSGAGNLKSIEEIAENGVVKGYKTIWNSQDEGGEVITQYYAFYDIAGKCGHIEIILSDNRSLDIFNKMVSTLKFDSAD